MTNAPGRRYVLLTPAKNEQSTLGQTIASVTTQSLPPDEWVIVSDGSTDQTDAMVAHAAEAYPWIQLLQLPARATRSFSAVVHATEAGLGKLRSTNYNYLGLLDADVHFASDYFERLIKRFEDNPSLGLAGGIVIDVDEPRNEVPRNLQDVPGAVQFFRRACFESLGGLLAIPEGGWDALTCAKARMNGFQTKLFPDLIVDHLKPRNVSQGGIFRRKWQTGVRDYALGYHPAFELAKCIGRVTEPPIGIAAIARFLGYCNATIQKQPRLIPPELMRFIRAEQMRRLTKHFNYKKNIDLTK